MAACANGEDAQREILREEPDVALLDVRMRDRDGLAILDALVAARCRTRVVFLSAFEDGALVHRALTSGAAGYLSKETDRDEICDAVLQAAAGEMVVSPTLPAALVGHLRLQGAPRQRFGGREREVMRLTAQGLTMPRSPAPRDRPDDGQDLHAARLPQARGHGPRRDGRRGDAPRPVT